MKKRHEMPEFEKWLDEKSYSQAEERIAEVVWRAALEWVLEQETWIGPDDGGEWGVDKWEIEEELRSAKT